MRAVGSEAKAKSAAFRQQMKAKEKRLRRDPQPFLVFDADELAMSAVGTASATTTVEAAATTAAMEAIAAATAVEATAARVAAVEAVAGAHAAAMEAATVVATAEALVGLGVVAPSTVGRTSGVIAEASVGSVVHSGLATVEA